LEKSLGQVISDFEIERQRWEARRREEAAQAKVEADGLRRLVALKTKDLKNIRKLAQVRNADWYFSFCVFLVSAALAVVSHAGPSTLFFLFFFLLFVFCLVFVLCFLFVFYTLFVSWPQRLHRLSPDVRSRVQMLPHTLKVRSDAPPYSEGSSNKD
jgi:hypothetical protein